MLRRACRARLGKETPFRMLKMSIKMIGVHTNDQRQSRALLIINTTRIEIRIAIGLF